MTVLAKDATFHISDIEVRHFKSGKREGQPYYYIKDGNRKFKTENKSVGERAQHFYEKHLPVLVVYHEETWNGNDGPVTTLVIDDLQEGQEALVKPSSDAQDSERMTKAEWDKKNDKDRIAKLFVTHLIQMTDWHQTLPPDDRLSYGEIIKEARKAAVGDLDWINSYATGDVPFD